MAMLETVTDGLQGHLHDSPLFAFMYTEHFLIMFWLPRQILREDALTCVLRSTFFIGILVDASVLCEFG